MVVREACVANRGMLCLAVGAAMLATACATSRVARQHSRPELHLDSRPEPRLAPNIRAAFPLESCVRTMLSRSSTFRQTYKMIAAHRGVRVNLWLAPVRRHRVRAKTDVRSFVGGERAADIRLYTTVGMVELIAHEMEHVREQLEGTNLLLLSVARSDDVHRIGGSFETRRGIETGLRVAAEVGPSAARMCEASVKNTALMSFSF
jgi:hypothetical protein